MRVAQFRRVPAHERRLVALIRRFERAREVGRRELLVRRRVRAIDRLDQIADAGAVLGRNVDLARPRHEIELARQRRLALLARVLIESVPLVDRDDQRAIRFEHVADQRRVLVGDAFVRVEHQHGHVRRFDGLQRLDHAEFLERILDARAAADAGGVDQRVAAAVAFERDADRIARRAGQLGRDHALFAEQTVHQRRLADVRPTDDRDADAFIRLPARRRFRPAAAAAARAPRAASPCRGCAPPTAATRSRCRARQIRRARRARRAPSILLTTRISGFAAAPQPVEDVAVGRQEPFARVDDEQHGIGFGDCDVDLAPRSER